MAQEITFQPLGLDRGRDTELASDSPGDPLPDGTTTMRVGLSGSDKRRVLVEFDLTGSRYGVAGVPRGSLVESASLSLTCTSAALSASACTVYSLEPGVRVLPSVQTWTDQDASTDWLTEGGDFDRAGGVASTLPTSTGAWEIDGLESLAQSALDSNDGILSLMVRKDNEASGAAQATFSRCVAASGWPSLTVTYSPRPAATASTSDPPEDPTAIGGLTGTILWGADRIGSSVIVGDSTPADP